MKGDETSQSQVAKVRRFFDLISLRETPYVGLLLAVALTVLNNKLLPVLLFAGYPLKIFVWNWTAFICCGALLLAWILCLAYAAISSLTQTYIQHTYLRRFVMALVYVLFTPFGFILLAWIALKKRRWLAVCLLGLALGLFVYAFLLSMEFVVSETWLSAVAKDSVPLVLMVGVFFVAESITRQNIVKIAFLLLVCSSAVHIMLRRNLNQDIVENRSRMKTMLTNCRKSANKQTAGEFPIEQEPLKSFIALSNKIKNELPSCDLILCRQDEIEKQYAEIADRCGAFRESIFALANTSPMLVSDEKTYDPELLDHPEITAFFSAARFLSLEMKAGGRRSELLRQNNAALASLCDWATRGKTFLHIAVAYNLENMRFEALAHTLSLNRYTEEEWLELLGDEPDWRYLSARIYEGSSQLLNNMLNRQENLGSNGKWLTNYLDSGIFFINDNKIAFLRNLFLSCSAADLSVNAELLRLTMDENSSFADAEQAIKDAKEEAKRKGLLFSLISPPVIFPYEKSRTIKDKRNLALLAWKVMEYRYEHNLTLPEQLDFLAVNPVDSINKLPISYEYGDIEVHSSNKKECLNIYGFRLHTCAKDGKDQSSKNAHTSIIVPLEQTAL